MAVTRISWAEKVWNPVVGCTQVSPGCANCYAIREAWRMKDNPNLKISSVYQGTVERASNGIVKWSGSLNVITRRINEPLNWRKPSLIFVNSMSDLFHDDMPMEALKEIWETMQAADWHRYLILTKRPENIRKFLGPNGIGVYAVEGPVPQPAHHIFFGTSTENQATFDIRVPELLNSPNALPWVSMEPLLGPVDTEWCLHKRRCEACNQWWDVNIDVCLNCHHGLIKNQPSIKWVIVGGESGHKARAMEPQWARDILEACKRANVPYHFKQWGSNCYGEQLPAILKGVFTSDPDSEEFKERLFTNLPKHSSRRELDGREWDLFPDFEWDYEEIRPYTRYY